MDKPKDTYHIALKPSGNRIEVKAGTLLSDAIDQVGLDLNLPCGGQGRCGRCKVVVEEGDVKRRSISRLSGTELEQGYALACQAAIESDLTVFIPPQEVILRKLPSEKEAKKVITLPVECDWRKNPIRSFFLEIEPPSLADNTTDFERLKRELARQHGIRGLVADLPMIKKLARILRDAHWRVTAVLDMGTWVSPDGPPRLIDLRPGD
ncbi:MAG: 2Fe-2S iron-sulfur cluster binding domain-containing protein, partial [Ardenticatenia bacterium]|nr:2Fe-2S iron-sulfur cluster binding domain-containing protein [Ardenticatenia bacterium]